MEQSAIFAPVLALIIWTMLVLLLMPYRRFKALFEGRVTADDFKLGESSRVPPEVTIPNRNYMNLLEAPVLFYAACFIVYLLHGVGLSAIILAWLYFSCRVVHSLIHLTYNNVEHRVILFAASNFVLLGIWVVAVVSYFELR